MAPKARAKRRFLRYCTLALLAPAVIAAVAAASWELETSTLQSRYLSRYASEIGYTVEQGENPQLRFPGQGPFDQRLGYARLPEMIARLKARGFEVEAQAKASPRFDETLDAGLFPIYDAKSQAGLQIAARAGEPLYRRAYPERVFGTSENVPRVVAESLTFIEDRDLLDDSLPYRNPAVSWRRIGAAVTLLGRRALGDDVSVPGASTLATQIEKFRHSAQGMTATPQEKLVQMATASVKAYRGGRETLGARQRILVDYLDGVPYSAIANHGEVHGFLDALRYWYGIDEQDIALLNDPVGPETDAAQVAHAGYTYRAALSLIVAGRGPSYHLQSAPGRLALQGLTDAYLRRLETAGVVPRTLAAAALDARLEPRTFASPAQPGPFTERKAPNAVRADLLQLLGLHSLYALDRYDLSVHTSIDDTTQRLVTDEVIRLGDPAYSASAGLTGDRLLPDGGSASMTFSFLLYEATPDGNALRVQTDNHDGPLDINRQTRLELGSTAKLRTLISYLGAIEKAYYDLLNSTEERQVEYRDAHADPLTRWVAFRLAAAPDLPLAEVLAEAMQRTYSASPAERFFTGGGMHQFANFDRESDDRSMTVEEAFQQSVNLVFIRMMRDVVRFHTKRLPDGAAVLEDTAHPARQHYLERFADREGQVFTTRFYRRHLGKTAEESVDLMAGAKPSATKLARIYRAVQPDAGADALRAFLESRAAADESAAAPGHTLGDAELQRLYDAADPERYHAADLGYLAGVHPLELWTVASLARRPETTLAELIANGVEARFDTYRWLFRSSRSAAQNGRIRIQLETDAFAAIHAEWWRLGYPFASLVPSYATAIGSSGDNPQALAELMGILVNDGVRRPLATIERLEFAAGTPFETRLRAKRSEGERVLSSAVAKVVRTALTGVVEHGTARRVHAVFARSDGSPLAVGGKTGTGDNQVRTVTAAGETVSSRALNRTATFVFFVERYFGVVTAYVEGEESAQYKFTSALPTQILRHLSEVLEPMLNGETPASPVWQLTTHDEAPATADRLAAGLREIG